MTDTNHSCQSGLSLGVARLEIQTYRFDLDL